MPYGRYHVCQTMKAGGGSLGRRPESLWNRLVLNGLAILMVGAVGFAGYRTGWELRLSFLFLIPITLVSWFVGVRSGVAISVASALGWLLAAREAGHSFSTDAILYWNSLLLLGVFLVFGCLLSALRRAHTREQSLARTDSLTKIANRHAFFELGRQEISRASRYGRPLTIVYVDLDDFKAVNDSRGHEEGDRLLVLIASTVRRSLRATDVVARLGGDESCVLLLETGPEDAAAACRKIQSELQAALLQDLPGVTLSMGAVVYTRPPTSVETMLRRADELMYAIKASGKNRFELQVMGPPSPAGAAEIANGAAR